MYSGLPGLIQEFSPMPTYEGKNHLYNSRIKYSSVTSSRPIFIEIFKRHQKGKKTDANRNVPLRSK